MPAASAFYTESGNGVARAPAALVVSVILHAAGLAFFMRLSFKPAEERLQTIDNVDLLVQEEEKKAEAPARPKAPPPSMKDFLKLALPAVPKPALQMPLEAKLIEPEKKLRDVNPKLEDKGKLKEPQKLDALDLTKKRPDLAKIEPLVDEHKARTLAALPKLEEVGGRQAARKTLELAALAEAEKGRLQPARMDALGALAPERHKAAQAAPLLPAEAAAAKPSGLSKIADMLTSDSNRVTMEPRAAAPRRAETLSAIAEVPAAPPQRLPEAQEVKKKKSVEIEGPLSNRRIVAHSVPAFPDWARDLGLVEAEVQIRFYVGPDGAVLPDNMRVERTSGYGRLDRLAVEHLKLWRFQAVADGRGNEWGLITFRFLLE